MTVKNRPNDMLLWSMILRVHVSKLQYLAAMAEQELVCRFYYRSGMVNSKSFVGKVLLRIKQKFELINAL